MLLIGTKVLRASPAPLPPDSLGAADIYRVQREMDPKMKWDQLAAVLLAINAICILADRALLKSDRSLIHPKLSAWANALKGIRVPFLPAVAAAKLSHFCRVYRHIAPR
jgi:hypothetical protein